MLGTEILLCFDPGKLSGIAVLERVDDAVRIAASTELDEDQCAFFIRSHMKDWQSREERDDVTFTVVCESFFITMETAKKSQAPFSLEMIGILKQCCRDVGYPLERIYWQKPSAAKTTVDNKKLHRLELWHRGGEGHALDAIRHGVLCLINRGWSDSRFLSSI